MFSRFCAKTGGRGGPAPPAPPPASTLCYTESCRLSSSFSTGTPMPKLKTHSGAAKRFKKTATGKFKRGQSKMRHILTSKETKTKKKLGRIVLVSKADTPKVARMLPYA